MEIKAGLQSLHAAMSCLLERLEYSREDLPDDDDGSRRKRRLENTASEIDTGEQLRKVLG